MLKKIILLLLVIAPVSMFAQEKIAYISAEEVFSTMPEFTQVQEKLKTKRDAIEKNAAAIQTEFTELYEKFSKSTEEPTESVVADRRKQLEQIEERYQNFLQTSQAEMEKEQQKLLTPIREKMQNAIKQVGDENNYTYIADAAAFVYISPNAIDATKQVKSKLGITN